jgi:prepilin-type N-terminal cleavage/methylation domain-containing protein
MKSIKAFTLIELLIVVAIIAILAAIAVPNFLEAQTRAKVSRAKADLRTTAVGLESYFVDNNRYPPSHARQDKTQTNAVNASGAGTPVNPRIQRLAWVTTPIAYLTSILNDPFSAGIVDAGNAINTQNPVFTYWDAPYSTGLRTQPSFLGTPNGGPADPWIDMLETKSLNNAYTLFCYAPDRDFEAATGSIIRVYDPTNGTISNGDIVRVSGTQIE